MLLCEFILRKMTERGTLTKQHTVVKTIVTTEVVRKIVDDYGADVIDVLTGFKFIGEKIKEFEQTGDRKFVYDLEESYGYLKGMYARDKDAVVAAIKYGYVKSGLKTLTLKGSDGAEKIKAIMKRMRENKPQTIAGYKVTEVKDYSNEIDGMPKSDVLKFFLDKGWFAVHPSGTEPKIKFYYEIEGDKGIDIKEIARDFKLSFD